MKFLIDTHIFLWMGSAPDALSKSALEILLNTENDLYISICSIWEMQIKHQLGKLELDMPLQELWKRQRDDALINLMQIEESHIWKLETLPQHHKDPFDRLLIAQASFEDIPIITADKHIARYDIKTIW